MFAAFLLDALVFVAVPLLVWRLAHRIVPLAVLPILIGVILAIVGDRLGAAPLVAPTPLGDLLGWAGVLVLAYAAGLEARPDAAAGGAGAGPPPAFPVARARLLAAAALALALPFAAGALAATLWLLPQAAWVPPVGGGGLAAAAIGLCLAVSALPVLIGIVRELPAADRPLGLLALRIAAVDDGALWIGLGGLLVLARAAEAGAVDLGAWGWRDAAAVALLALLAAAGRALDRLAPEIPPPAAWILALVWLMAGAWSTATLGIHALLGAYFAGSLTPHAVAARLPAERIGFVALALLAPFFFGHRGLGIDGGVFGGAALAAAAGLFAIAAASKVAAVVILPPSRALGRGEALMLGALLQCKGLMEIVAATILRDQGLLSETGYAVLVVLAILSTSLTKPLAGLCRRWRPPPGRR
jgi:Kef-type K+ transport system membrane component KefB